MGNLCANPPDSRPSTPTRNNKNGPITAEMNLNSDPHQQAKQEAAKLLEEHEKQIQKRKEEEHNKKMEI